MKVYAIKFNSVNFKSKNNPIEPFVIKTQKGDLFVKEFKGSDANSYQKSRNLAKFFVDGFISNTNDPSFLSLKDENNIERYKHTIRIFTRYYQSMFQKDDGNTTMLVARNKQNKLCGAIVTNTLNEAGVKDSATCYIDSIVVAPEYRKCGVGRKLMEKVLSCSKDIYTDAFLTSDNLAVGFETKNGYRILDYSNPNERKIIDQINSQRGDYPDYVTYMHKKLKDDKTNTPWAERVKFE